LLKILQSGSILDRKDVEVLRPCPANALPPYEIQNIIGKILVNNVTSGECIRWSDLK